MRARLKSTCFIILSLLFLESYHNHKFINKKIGKKEILFSLSRPLTAFTHIDSLQFIS